MMDKSVTDRQMKDKWFLSGTLLCLHHKHEYVFSTINTYGYVAIYDPSYNNETEGSTEGG